MSALEVVDPGALTLVQDTGRPGLAALGVPRSGALDTAAAALARRLVDAPPGAAVLESVLGGLEVRPAVGLWAAVTGAPAPVWVDGRPVAWGRAVRVPAGSRLRIGTPSLGARTYLAVAGGIAVPPVLGSRSTDTLTGLGPPPVARGAVLRLVAASGPPSLHDGLVALAPSGDPLRVHLGPHVHLFPGTAWRDLLAAEFTVAPDSDRVGLRLHGAALPGGVDRLPSEGMVHGAVQVPPAGRPIVFLADHPTTGGYPVLAVVDPADLDRCAQLRPGDVVRFAAARG